MFIELDQVPLRDPTLSPEEILMSESQERMMAVVEPRHVEPFLGLVHNPPNRSPNQRPLQLLNGQKLAKSGLKQPLLAPRVGQRPRQGTKPARHGLPGRHEPTHPSDLLTR